MTLIDVLHMSSGSGDSSYAHNSRYTKIVIQETTPFLKRAIKSMANQDVPFDDCFKFADLGCSSGSNTLFLASNIIEIVHEVCQDGKRKIPQFQVCLNDLYVNDFNNVFKLLPDFYKTLKKEKGENFGPYFVSAVPGSFYGRLFPDKSLHLVHSCYSIHWLSQVCVPKGIEDNKLNIYVSRTSPLNVMQAYENQFHTDFTKFLQLRSEEIVPGGRMVLTLRGRSSLDPTSDDYGSFWELLTISLREMLEEGLVQESDINSFNLPFYFPHEDELRSIVQTEESFSLDHMTSFEVDVDQEDTDYTDCGKNTSKAIRAVTETLFASHFGNSIIDVLFKKYEKNAMEHLGAKESKNVTVLVLLTKK
ncbi:hypothetical protein M8C21_010155 [Ambrosia artemisiifolia]|uniref:Uncharacterized protein n=1 Tax=Ambrosia artemisiifolia TaxID=4212 RepID=A0AAD5D5Z9_AMBAR|nr:hypothetical protein M8C21_010155 [Ambrosia artemisiifolia]